MAAERRRRRTRAGAASSVPSLVKDLVDQFDRPLDFFRELIQNAIDAGSNRVDVTLERDGEVAVIRIEDDGEGMDEQVIDNFLLVLFRSTKEEDFTKIGKFGIGFVSVFALRPNLVRVLTAKEGESWRIDFPSYKRYEKYRLSEPREGTLIEIHKKMSRGEFEKLAGKARDTIRYWCKHSESRIFFSGEPGARPELISEPFGMKGASLKYEEEGTDISVSFSDEEAPFFGFYNRGLTLKEGQHSHFPGVSFKAKSRYLEHTLTRDNVMVDENYHKLMAILKRLVERDLPAKVRAELRELATKISKAHSHAPPEGPPEKEIAPLVREWRKRLPYLLWLYSGYFSRWKRSDWAVFPSLSGRPISLSLIKKSTKDADDRLYFDSAPNGVTRALSEQGLKMLPPGPWVSCLSTWLHVEAVQASQAYIRPPLLPDRKLEAPMKSFLSTLRWLDSQSGSKYRGIAAADLAYPGSPVKDRLFVTQMDPGSLSEARKRPVSSLLWFRKTRHWALVHAGHPSVEKLARLHGTRPGLAAFLCLKMMHLHDGEVPPDQESEYCNLAEKIEARLLAGALKLDEKRGRECRTNTPS